MGGRIPGEKRESVCGQGVGRVGGSKGFFCSFGSSILGKNARLVGFGVAKKIRIPT